MESLGYILVYFAKGSLPWQGIHANTKRDKYRRILNKKKQVPLDELCSELPSLFRRYLEYCRRLRFDETPDYDYLRGLFAGFMKREGMENSAKQEDVRTSEEMAEKLQTISTKLMDDGEKLFFDTLPREILRITRRMDVGLSLHL